MPENFDVIFIWALVLAALAALIAVITVIVRYKRKLKSPIYPVKKYANLALSVSRDDFMGKTLTAVKVASDKKR